MLAIGLALIGSGMAGFALMFFWPVNHEYAFAGNNCFFSPVWLPETAPAATDGGFELTQNPLISVAGYPLYSHTACVEPTEAVKPETSYALALQPFGNSLLTKKITISNAALPTAAAQIQQDGLIATRLPFVFSLDKPDSTFTYRLSANKQDVMCASVESSLRCGLEPLKLKQSKSYTFILDRMYDGQTVETVFKQKLTTVEPVKIKSSSIKNGSTVYNKAEKLTVAFSKTLASVDGVRLDAVDGKQRNEVAIKTELNGSKLTVMFQKPLARQVEYVLSIDSARAADQGFLAKPYTLKFETSGGPKVKGINIGSYGVSQNPLITLTFDTAVNKSKISRFVSLQNNSGTLAATISVNGRTVTIDPTAALPWCQSFTVQVKDGLSNSHGISGGSSWKYDSRTLCYKTSVIGYSLKGRAILAYTLGSGSQRIIFAGATHGDEPSSKYILDSFINSLDANIGSIPKNRQIIVIPSVNPDGVASGSRTNARNVDLNRNFPANDWKEDVVMPGGKLNKGGGGNEPLSEPESKALANFILAQNPILVMNYHAIGSLAIANESGNSRALATAYGSLTGYAALGNNQLGNTFTHDTTGALTDWLHDSHSIPAVLVELSTYGYNEFSGHSAAMWEMIKR